MQLQFPRSRTADIVVTELDDEVLIYDLKINKAYSLNETSALVWKLCDGQRSLSEISRLVGEKLNASVDEGLVWLALDQLRQSDLIEHETALPDSLAGLSRRQVMRKIGLAATIALPLVSSLVAPTPAAAASVPRLPEPINPQFQPIPVGPVAPSTLPVPPAPLQEPLFNPIPIGGNFPIEFWRRRSR